MRNRVLWPLVGFLLFLIIIGAALPHLGGSRRSSVALTKMKMGRVVTASKQYFREYGFWPTNMDNLEPAGNQRQLMLNAPGATNDAWRRPLVYHSFDQSVGFGKVISLGRDGKPGGKGLDADIEVKFSAE